MSSFLTDVVRELFEIVSAEFSQPAEISVGTLTFSISGIFDKTFLTVDNEGAAVQSNFPQIGVFIKTIDDSLGHELSEDDNPVLTTGGESYEIAYIERDGTGYARILLKKIVRSI